MRQKISPAKPLTKPALRSPIARIKDKSPHTAPKRGGKQLKRRSQARASADSSRFAGQTSSDQTTWKWRGTRRELLSKFAVRSDTYAKSGDWQSAELPCSWRILLLPSFPTSF